MFQFCSIKKNVAFWGCLLADNHHFCFLAFQVQTFFFCFHFSPHLAGSVGLFDFLLLVPCRLHILRLLVIFPPILSSGISSSSRRIVSLYRLKRSGERRHPCRTPLIMSWKAQVSFSILTAAVCSQYIFFIIRKSFASTCSF